MEVNESKIACDLSYENRADPQAMQEDRNGFGQRDAIQRRDSTGFYSASIIHGYLTASLELHARF